MTTDQPQPGGSGAGSTAEDWARVFHDTYEQLAPDFGYQTRSDTRQFDPDSANGRLMIAVVGRVTAQLRADLAAAQAEIKRLTHQRSLHLEASDGYLAEVYEAKRALSEARATIERQNAVITAARNHLEHASKGNWHIDGPTLFADLIAIDAALASLDRATTEATASQDGSNSPQKAPSRVPAPNHGHTDAENADGPYRGVADGEA